MKNKKNRCLLPSIIIAMDVSSFNAPDKTNVYRTEIRKNLQLACKNLIDTNNIIVHGKNDTGDGLILIFNQVDLHNIYNDFIKNLEKEFITFKDVFVRIAVHCGIVNIENMPLTEKGFSSDEVNETCRLLDSNLFRLTRKNNNITNNPLIIYSKTFFNKFIENEDLDDTTNFLKVEVETKDNFVEAWIHKVSENQIIDINNKIKLKFNSAKSFSKSVLEMNRGVFFNVQIDLKEWFSPELQIHLALQESLRHSIQLEKKMFDCISSGINHINKEYFEKCHNHVPKKIFSRVFFLEQTKDELDVLFRHLDIRARNLASFIKIQNMMSCPVAVVTIDQLIEILIENLEILLDTNPNFPIALGLPDDMVNNLKQLISHSDKVLLKYINELRKNDWFTKQKITNGKINPNMDFAIFSKNFKTPCEWETVWAATKTIDSELAYYPIENKPIKSLNDYFTGLKIDIDNSLPCTNKERRDVLIEFGNIIFEEVFLFDKIENNETEIAPDGRKFDPIYRIINDEEITLTSEYNYITKDKYSCKKIIEALSV